MIPVLPADKANHFFYGSLAAYTGAAVGMYIRVSPGYLGQAAAFGIGFLRELYNWKYTTGFSWADLAVTTLAGTPLMALQA